MEALVIGAGFIVVALLVWNIRVIWYAYSGEYEIDQRLKAISK